MERENELKNYYKRVFLIFFLIGMIGLLAAASTAGWVNTKTRSTVYLGLKDDLWPHLSITRIYPDGWYKGWFFQILEITEIYHIIFSPMQLKDPNQWENG